MFKKLTNKIFKRKKALYFEIKGANKEKEKAIFKRFYEEAKNTTKYIVIFAIICILFFVFCLVMGAII